MTDITKLVHKAVHNNNKVQYTKAAKVFDAFDKYFKIDHYTILKKSLCVHTQYGLIAIIITHDDMLQVYCAELDWTNKLIGTVVTAEQSASNMYSLLKEQAHDRMLAAVPSLILAIVCLVTFLFFWIAAWW